MLEAINYTNHNSGPTVVISDPDEQGMRYIHTKADVMLHPLCPENDQYVHAILNSFFPIKETMHYKFMELKSRQTEATAPRISPQSARTDPTPDAAPRIVHRSATYPHCGGGVERSDNS